LKDEPIRWAPAISERGSMLRVIGVKDVWELYSDVPKRLILKEPPAVGFGHQLSEEELRRLWNSYMREVRAFTDPPPFMGGGWCPHMVPALVDEVLRRGEFYTAYTPYQPEINQGLLQALFEYQSLMADLLEMDVVNASMYDGSTATAEAVLMAMRVTRRHRIVVSEALHPEYMETLRTWLMGPGAELVAAPLAEDGRLDMGGLEELVTRDTAALVVPNPNFFGELDDNMEAYADLAHKRGALFITVVEPLSLGLVKPPGSYGADIAVGEGQPLGLGMNYGGPGLGIFAVRWERRLVRQMPGRLIGMTRTADGERAFTMILQTREQHIRRERATSNITTNEALMAVAAAVYLTMLGANGLRRLARSIWLRSHYLARRLDELPGVAAPRPSELDFFKEFVAVFDKPYEEVHRFLLEKGVLGGLPLSRYWPSRSRESLFCTTEVHSRDDIDLLVDLIAEALGAR